jgi:hypothetical protein
MKTLILVILITLVSCNEYKNKVEFKNSSNVIIDSIKLYGNTICKPLVIKNLKPGDFGFGKLENCTDVGGDGSYRLEVFYDNKTTTKGFGYFTNGYAIFKEFKISLYKDNFIVVQELY